MKTQILNTIMKKQLMACACAFLSALTAMAVAPSEARFHDEHSDTTRINEILVEALSQKLVTPRMASGWIGRQFLGVPYVAHTLEGDSEQLTVNLDELDCTTYVENVIALALTVGERRSSWRDFVYNLERIRYRSGHLNGYASRLHYIADWALDNQYRGNFKDVTTLFPQYTYIIKTIDFMSENADKYPALADSASLARIRDVERGYRGHKINYIKTPALAYKSTKEAFQDGDIVALVTKMKNLDVTHMGMIVMKDGEPYLMHASSSLGKVVISDVPLAEFMKRNHGLLGVRVFRLND